MVIPKIEPFENFPLYGNNKMTVTMFSRNLGALEMLPYISENSHATFEIYLHGKNQQWYMYVHTHYTIFLVKIHHKDNDYARSLPNF